MPGLRFVIRIAVVCSIVALFIAALALLYFSAHVLLLVFAGVLLAVVLHNASDKLGQLLHLPRLAALALVIALAFCVIGLTAWFFAPSVAQQSLQLLGDIPASLRALQKRLERFSSVHELLRHLTSSEQAVPDASTTLSGAGRLFSGAVGALGSFVVILFIGIYLAAQPEVYIRGVLRLLPHDRRPRAREILDKLGTTLNLWLLGKMLSMLIIGTATGIGLHLLGVPLALVLAVVAGLLDFVPYIGPILAAIPAILIAFTQSPLLALYVLLMFLGLHTFEGYMLLPLVERRTVSVPPALNISMQVLLGLPFGLTGVALATPLTAALMVLISMLYVQDVLGDRVKLPSDHS